MQKKLDSRMSKLLDHTIKNKKIKSKDRSYRDFVSFIIGRLQHKHGNSSNITNKVQSLMDQ